MEPRLNPCNSAVVLQVDCDVNTTSPADLDDPCSRVYKNDARVVFTFHGQ